MGCVPHSGRRARVTALLAVLILLFAGALSRADAVVPVANSFVPSSNATNGTSGTFSLVFNTSVTGLTTADFTLGGTASGWAIGGVTGSGTTYQLTVDGTSGSEGTVIPTLAAGSVTDSTSTAGPSAPRAASALTVDRTDPVVTASTEPSGTQRAVTLAYTVTFDAPLASGSLAAGDLTVGGTSRQVLGAAGAWSVQSISGSGAGPYTITLSGGTTPSSGTVTLQLAANSVSDTAGNTGPAAPLAWSDVTTEYEITNTARPALSGT
ncbi:MAG: hypothetical protein ACO3PB_07310, partial [Miltoncostaeaceae bacterium]